MIRTILKIYSAIFRYGGLLMAVMSFIVSVMMGIDIVLHGYLLVEGHRSHSLTSILTAVGTPLIGVALGLALYFLVPKVGRASDK